MEPKMKMGLGVFAFLLGVVVLVVTFRFVDAANLLTSLEETNGSCWALEAVPGPEDIVIDRELGIAYVSSMDRRMLARGGAESESLEGGIYRIDLNENAEMWQLTPMRLSDRGWGPNLFRPHGIGLLVDGDGNRSLFVVNHPPGKADEVVIFDLPGDGLLSYRRNISDQMLFDLNDVQPVGRNAFYATNDHGSGTSTTLQDLLLLDRSNLVYFDGVKGRVAADGLTYANGVNVSADGRSLYVVETLDGNLRIYDREVESGRLTLSETLDLGMSADNIDVLENGDLLIGGHPKILDFTSHAMDPTHPSPSQVVRVSLSMGAPSSLQTVYLDDGKEISGVAVAAKFKDVMLLGPVFQPTILVCSLN